MFLQSGAGNSSRIARRTLRILVADDEPDTVETLLTILRDEGHEAAGAHDGGDALRLARELKPDAILIDIGMPGLNGYDLARALKAEHGPRCPILIAVTAYARTSERLMGRAAGFDYYFGKPVEIPELLAALSQGKPA